MNAAEESFAEHEGIEYPAHDTTQYPAYKNLREAVAISLLVQTSAVHFAAYKRPLVHIAWLHHMHVG